METIIFPAGTRLGGDMTITGDQLTVTLGPGKTYIPTDLTTSSSVEGVATEALENQGGGNLGVAHVLSQDTSAPSA